MKYLVSSWENLSDLSIQSFCIFEEAKIAFDSIYGKHRRLSVSAEGRVALIFSGIPQASPFVRSASTYGVV